MNKTVALVKFRQMTPGKKGAPFAGKVYHYLVPPHITLVPGDYILIENRNEPHVAKVVAVKEQSTFAKKYIMSKIHMNNNASQFIEQPKVTGIRFPLSC